MKDFLVGFAVGGLTLLFLPSPWPRSAQYFLIATGGTLAGAAVVVLAAGDR